MTKNSIRNEVYGDLASFGRFMVIIWTIVGTIIGLACIFGGIAILRHKNKRTGTVTGNITVTPQCSTTVNEKNTNYDCRFTVEYKVDGKSYNHNFHTNSNTNYSNLRTIELHYDPNNPADSSLEKNLSKNLGWFALVFGLFVLIGTWVRLWVVRKYKVAAAASGAAGAYDIVRHVI